MSLRPPLNLEGCQKVAGRLRAAAPPVSNPRKSGPTLKESQKNYLHEAPSCRLPSKFRNCVTHNCCKKKTCRSVDEKRLCFEMDRRRVTAIRTKREGKPHDLR